jgi:ferritin-like metal-binding protein YciE
MALKSLMDLLVHELRDLLSAEKQLVKALPKMAKAATCEHLKAGFEEHLEQTKVHVERLEQAFQKLDLTARAHKCQAMEGLIKEGAEMIAEDAEDAVKDAGLIASAQRVEHYEMAGYGTAIAFARRLGHDEVASILIETLEEERDTDRKLTELAESEVNASAE